MATNSGPDAVAATQRIRVAGWERRAAAADLFAPRLQGSINYIRFSEPFFNFGTGSFSPNAAAASLEASYVILGAGKLGTLKSSRAALESAFRQYRDALAGCEHLVCYAVKANSNLAVLNLLSRLGAGFDIVSGGELQRVHEHSGDHQLAFLGGTGHQ